jgi:hypothetical protein
MIAEIINNSKYFLASSIKIQIKILKFYRKINWQGALWGEISPNTIDVTTDNENAQLAQTWAVWGIINRLSSLLNPLF